MRIDEANSGPLLRHAALGSAFFLGNLALMWMLVALASLHVLTATVICFFVLNALSHHLSRRFVFNHSGRRYRHSLGRYLAVMAISLALNLAGMAMATQWLQIPYLLASSMIAILFFLANFIAHRDWTFR
jgi:putative flippase GtrA